MARFTEIVLVVAILAVAKAIPVTNRQVEPLQFPQVFASPEPSFAPDASAGPLFPTAEPLLPILPTSEPGAVIVTPAPGTGVGALLATAEPAAPTATKPSSTSASPANTNGASTPLTGSTSAAVEPGQAGTKKPMNEGCVAIEHLEGFALQHSEHLVRDVLCANNFCATPNHAIEVKGVGMTSMKQMCASKWDCAKSVKLVNNLRLIKNTRAVVNDLITVTPYDLRFPRWCVVVVQLAQELAYVLSSSAVVFGSVLAVAAFSARKSKML